MFSSWQTVILFFLSGTSAVVGNSLLKAGMNQLKNLNLTANALPQTIASLAGNWQIVLGFLLYGASSILYLKLLSYVDVTKAYPTLVAYMAIVILLLGALFLKEPLTLIKLLGVMVIVGGIYLLNR